MPRNFLAPYKFILKEGLEKNGLIKCLNYLKENPYKDQTEQTIIKCREIKYQTLNIVGNLIVGKTEYGKYGSFLDVIDVLSGEKTKEIKENESPLDQYYYLFNFSTDTEGILILQRIGNIGIRRMLERAINSYSDGKIIIQPIFLGIKKILKEEIVEIKIEIPRIPKLVDEKLLNKKVVIQDKESITTTISLKAKKNKKIISNIVTWIKKNFENVEEANIGYIFDEKEILKITVRMGRSRRTINIPAKKFRSWIEVKNVNSISEEALDLLKYIKEEETSHV